MQSPINQTNLDKIKSDFTQKKLLRFDGWPTSPTTANIIVTKLICWSTVYVRKKIILDTFMIPQGFSTFVLNYKSTLSNLNSKHHKLMK